MLQNYDKCATKNLLERCRVYMLLNNIIRVWFWCNQSISQSKSPD